MLSTSLTVIGHVRVIATGQRRVNSVAHDQAPGDEALSDHLRDHLPRDVADHIEAFRKRAGMSAETLGELRRLWDGAGGHSDDALGRADHVHWFMSLRAKRELERFHRELARLPRHVVPALKHALGTAAMRELLRPEWRF